MSKLKIIFNQTLMISTGIFFCIGIGYAIQYFLMGIYRIQWLWYTPLSIVLSGFFCALPTLFLLSLDNLKGFKMWLCIFLHFMSVGIVLTVCGFLFNWYDSLVELICILIMYVLIYIFVWAATYWITKSDERKINTVLQNLRDEE